MYVYAYLTVTDDQAVHMQVKMSHTQAILIIYATTICMYVYDVYVCMCVSACICVPAVLVEATYNFEA